MPRNKAPCPDCGEEKDRRALRCNSCRFKFSHPRKGSGQDWHVGVGGYICCYGQHVSDMYQHRHVMQEHLGRKLRTDEHVHHKDGDRTNNTLSNLELLSASDHAREHSPPDKMAAISKLGHAARWGA